GSTEIAEVTLGRNDRDGRSAGEHLRNRLRLFGIAAACAQAVSVDMANFFRRYRAFAQSPTEHVGKSRLALTDPALVADGRRGRTNDFAEDFRAPGLSVLELFQHQSGGPFAHDRSCSIAIERP